MMPSVQNCDFLSTYVEETVSPSFTPHHYSLFDIYFRDYPQLAGFLSVFFRHLFGSKSFR